MGSLLDKAIIYAVQAHSGMVRKGTTTPYIVHPLEAAAIVASMTDEEEVIQLLCYMMFLKMPATVNQLIEEFGKRVAALVSAESEDKREDTPAAETWKLRKQETINLLINEKCLPVKMVALGDKLSNVRAMYRDYQAIGDRLWDRFNQKDKSEHGWYYRSIADATMELSEYPAWQEYERLVSLLFKN